MKPVSNKIQSVCFDRSRRAGGKIYDQVNWGVIGEVEELLWIDPAGRSRMTLSAKTKTMVYDQVKRNLQP